jgi:restriction endonuclease S subunit
VFIELEEKVAEKTTKKLGDFIISISGGATPNREKDNELYTNKEKGIPFLRVQNITESGLVLDDVKYITEEVHKTQLKRSQVKEDNLLITITGRIASSCVVPKGFEGNINQHSVVIETKDRKTAEIIATFLNSTVGHKLAIRRISGGSRPALDYEALKSIPIILDDKIFSLMEKAYSSKKSKESQAQQLLDSINDYVLSELGIKMPELKDRMTFTVYSDKIKDERFDPNYYQPKFEAIEKAVNNGKYEVKEIGQTLEINSNIENIQNYDKIQYIDLSSIEKGSGKIKDILVMKSSEAPSRARQKTEYMDLLLAGLSGSLKSIAVFNNTEKDNFICSTGFYVIKHSKNYNNYYLWALFRSQLYQCLLNREASGAIMPAVNRESLSKLKIPMPPIEIQNKIADEVKRRMQKADQLRKEAEEKLEKSKEDVEKLILSNS